MTFPKYPEYKDSGVEWLGEVPAHWDVRRLKFVLSQITDRATERVNPVALENIEGWSGRYVEGESDYSGEGVAFRKGDLLFGKLRPYLAKVYLPSRRGEAVGDFHVMRPCPNLSERYAFHQLLQPQFISVVDGATHGAKMPRVGWEVMGNMPFVTPPHYEQAHIATFLDHETARIDALVEEQQRLVELLKEKRQAVISHAVTKGLDPDVPMKDSGVEWLGEVPAHWKVLRLKNVSPEITVGIVVEPSKYYVNDGVPALRSLNVRPGRISTDQMVYISPDANELLAKSKLRSGDLVAVRSGQPGTTAVVPPELDGCNCIDLIIIRKPSVACEKFLCWFFASDCAVRQFSEGSGGAIQQHFNISTAANVVVPTPSRSEQVRIAEYIDNEISKIDELVATAESTSQLLSERRSALISAAVTGKIDVRGWKPPEGSTASSEATQTEVV